VTTVRVSIQEAVYSEASSNERRLSDTESFCAGVPLSARARAGIL